MNDRFLSGIPAMRQNTQAQLAKAMSDAGFTGNRWSVSMRADQIAADAAMRENALLSSLLSDAAWKKEG